MAKAKSSSKPKATTAAAGATIPKLTKEQVAQSLNDIDAAYHDLLFRAPDRDGQAAYQRDLLNGDMTVEQMRLNIMKSDEYRDKHPIEPPPIDVLPAPALSIVGTDFMTEAGIWKYRGITAFTAWQDWKAGDRAKLERYAQFARGLGVTAWRVFGEWVVTNFRIDLSPQNYDQLAEFTTWLNRHGFALHYVCFTGQQNPALHLSDAAQQTHWKNVGKVFAGYPSTLLEVNNEDWKNGTIASKFAKPAKVLCTRSAWQDGQSYQQPGPLMDWTTEHTPRDDEWERKAKHMLDTARLGLSPESPPTNKPAIGGEPKGVANADVPGARTSDLHACYEYFAVAELYSAGACLHGDLSQLQHCLVPTPGKALDCCNSVAEAWKVGIPVDAASKGTYTRGGLPDCPIEHSDTKALRTYAMLQGSKATVVVVRPTHEWHAVPVNGWRLVRQAGTKQQVVFLEK